MSAPTCHTLLSAIQPDGHLHKCHLPAKYTTHLSLDPSPQLHPSKRLIGKTQPGGIC